MLYRLVDRRKKPYPPPNSRRLVPHKMMKPPPHESRPIMKQEEHQSFTPKKRATGREPTITHRQEWTRCNNERCKRCKDGPGHGPYWYAYWREGETVKKKYIGKSLAPAARPPDVSCGIR